MSRMNVVATAPGKVILHGEHAVVYGTKAIAVSVGLNTSVSIKESEDFKIIFEAVGINASIDTSELTKLKSLLGENFRFAKLNASATIKIDESAVKKLEGFILEHPGFLTKRDFETALVSSLYIYMALFDEVTPVEICVKTDLPVGAGLGSSASFAVALTAALLVASGRTSKSQPDMELINRWAYVSECFVHGNPSGLDNSICTYGGAIIFKKNEPLIFVQSSGMNVLVVSTEVSRSTKALVAKVAELKTKSPDLHKSLIEDIEQVVTKAIESLKSTGSTTAGLMEENQRLLEALGVSHPSLDFIVKTAKKKGLSAKLTGAGGGGCAIILLPKNLSVEVLNNLKKELTESSRGFKYWNVPLAGHGLKIN